MAKKNSIESAAISFNSEDDGSFPASCVPILGGLYVLRGVVMSSRRR